MISEMQSFWLIILCLCILSVVVVNSFEPFTIGLSVVAGGAALLGTGFQMVKCRVFAECCDDKSIHANLTGLRYDLETQLHGQHLVVGTVIKSIRGHFNNPNPQKALVLSLHGCTGCGKNFVSQIIAKNLFDKGIHSNFVHVLVATHHFPHEHQVEAYKDNLRMWIKGNVSNCERSMFIFDEMDKMPESLIDAIQSYIDHHPIIDGVDFRKSIFLFLSNSGSDAITNHTLMHWKEGRERERLELKDMEQILMLGAFNEKGGLWHSSLIEKNLISAFVPFLPMERTHVKKCIIDDFERKRKQHNDQKGNRKRGPAHKDAIDAVADNLLYYPDDLQLYAKSGCKRVSQKVDLVLDDMT